MSKPANSIKDSGERWRTCIFAWVDSPIRLFDENKELTYLAAFAHSVQAKLANMETMASDIAKGSFISSVSHELRSPLHGILAGVELIQDSQLSDFQAEMAMGIALAGRTLLDTSVAPAFTEKSFTNKLSA